MAWTSPRTWTNTVVSASDLNTDIRDNTGWLKDAFTTIGQTTSTTAGQLRSAAYGCVLIRTAVQSISDSTYTAVTFPSADADEELDTDSMHNESTNTSRITIPAGGGGWYDIGAEVQFEANSTGVRLCQIELNGSANAGTVIALDRRDATSAGQGIVAVSTFALFDAGDYITLNVYQTSGGAKDIQANNHSVRFWCMRRFIV